MKFIFDWLRGKDIEEARDRLYPSEKIIEQKKCLEDLGKNIITHEDVDVALWKRIKNIERKIKLKK